MEKELFVAKSADLPDGQRKIVPNGNNEIGVYRVNGELYAYLSLCPHQGGPACEGLLMAQVEERRRQDLSRHALQSRRHAYRVPVAWLGIPSR
jgi:nitrite reductase/ring-hydroxylating ferredoxin subunit